MQIPDEIRKCVAFVASRRKNDSWKCHGTAFFVVERIEGSDRHCTYAVTARHVIEGVERASLDAGIYLRLNSQSGEADYVRTEKSDWRFHPEDDRIDVAICQFWFPESANHRAYPVLRFATEDVIHSEGIGVGDDLFLTGLFTHHAGRKNNIPIVRVGNIAGMPQEKVVTRTMGEMEAFLVESRSIGGLSGSPVFVHLGSTRIGGGVLNLAAGIRFYLLGLMHGHWDVKEHGMDDAREDAFIRGEQAVNMGIAIVVPAAKVLEALCQPAFDALRNRILMSVERDEKIVVSSISADPEAPDALQNTQIVSSPNIDLDELAASVGMEVDEDTTDVYPSGPKESDDLD